MKYVKLILLFIAFLVGENSCDLRTFQSRLIEHYGSSINFISRPGKSTIVYFTDMEYDILRQSWINNQKDE